MKPVVLISSNLRSVRRLLIALLGMCAQASSGPAGIAATSVQPPLLDDFDTSHGWREEIPYGFREAGEARVQDGHVVVVRHPFGQHHAVYMEKEYERTVRANEWIHFKVQFAPLLGADMYTHIYFDGDLAVQIGINGEQHWKQPAVCEQKPCDDECFITVPAMYGTASGNIDDIRVRFPVAHTRPKCESGILFSIKNEVTESGPALRIFVNGREIIPEDLDAQGSERALDLRLRRPLVAQRTVKVSFGTVGGGADYAATWDPQGVRQRWCYAQFTPARPSRMAQPADRDKCPWMLRLDAVRNVIEDGSLDEVGRRLALWSRIYAGSIDFETAVLSGAIPLPAPDHIQWTFGQPGLRQRLLGSLQRMDMFHQNNTDSLERYVWDRVYAEGNTALAVHHGYLTPPAVRSSPIWQFLSPTERAEIPQVAELTSSVQEWDFLIFANRENRDSLKSAILQLICEGRIGVAEAIFVELLSWQDAESFCRFLSKEDILEIRAHPQGSPYYCPHCVVD